MGTKTDDLSAYGDYNRFADPHMRRYLKRKHVISTKHFVPQGREFYIQEPKLFSSENRISLGSRKKSGN